MTMNKQDDKALAEDHAFIQSLYDDVLNHDKERSDHPSEQLNQRILAKAHKAVGTKPILCLDETSTPLTNNKEATLSQATKHQKKTAWYYPLATVASLLLVAILVKHQLYNPMTPIDEIDSLVMMEPIVGTKQSKSSTPPAEMIRPSATRSLFKKEKQISELNIAFVEGQRENKMLQLAAVSTQQRTRKSKQHAKIESVNTSFSIILSHEKYKSMQAQSTQKTLYWQLQHENSSTYIIELFNTATSSTFYRLDKKRFRLNKKDKNRKNSFSEIIYIVDKE